MTSYSQSDHILGENSLQSVVKSVTILFSMWQEKLKIFMEWTVFSFIAILFLILLYMFAIKKSINTLKWPNPEIFKLHHIRSWSQILEFHISYQFFLGLMCYTKIRKDENKLSIIDLTSYSQSDHILGENSLHLVVKMSQSYFLCDRKSWKFSWNKLFFPSLPSYFLFHNTCLQSKNWWTLWNDRILKFSNFTLSEAEVKF